MCLIGVPNLKKSIYKKVVLKVFKQYKEKDKKIKQISGTHISLTAVAIPLNVVCEVVYMENIEYINLIETGLVVIKTRGIKTVT